MLNLITIPMTNTDSKTRRITYLTGRTLAKAYMSSDITAAEVADYVGGVRESATYADFLAGYRDGIDFYDVNRTGASWDEIARLYYAAKGILPQTVDYVTEMTPTERGVFASMSQNRTELDRMGSLAPAPVRRTF